MSRPSKYITTSARLSGCGFFRFTLERRWAEAGTRVAFVGLNPSTADEREDDPTIRRCVGFARSWGHAALTMLNLFSIRSTDPSGILGPLSDHAERGLNFDEIEEAIAGVDMIVCAWGVHGTHEWRDRDFIARFSPQRHLFALGLTKGGNPRHPLYLRKDLKPELWIPKGTYLAPSKHEVKL